MRLTLSGHYICRVYKTDGSLRSEYCFDNLITNAGLDRYGFINTSSQTAFGYAMVGSGTSIAQATDTTLANKIAHTTTTANSASGYNSGTPDYVYSRITYRFLPGSLNNVTLTEVGVGWTTTQVFSRALILDSNGQPTSIVVLADEYFDLTYELRFFPPISDETFLLNIGTQQNVPVTVRPIRVTVFGPNFYTGAGTTGWGNLLGTTSGAIYPREVDRSNDGLYFQVGTQTGLDARTSTNFSFTGGSDGLSSNAWSAIGSYVPGSFQRQFKITVGLDAGNPSFNHIRMAFRFGGTWQIHFGSAIVKTSNDIVEMTLTYSWGRL
jgi:hypothetical protein